MAAGKIVLSNTQYELEGASGLTAYVRHDQSDLAWSIKAETRESYSIADWDEPIEEDVVAELFFQVAGCRSLEELAGVKLGPLSPDLKMLPDDAASFYRGGHIATEEHAIEFGNASNLEIEVDWRFKAVEEREVGMINVFGHLPLISVLVWTAESDEVTQKRMDSVLSSDQVMQQWQPNWDDAKAIVSQFFPLQIFSEPIKLRGPLRFPVSPRP